MPAGSRAPGWRAGCALAAGAALAAAAWWGRRPGRGAGDAAAQAPPVLAGPLAAPETRRASRAAGPAGGAAASLGLLRQANLSQSPAPAPKDPAEPSVPAPKAALLRDARIDWVALPGGRFLSGYSKGMGSVVKMVRAKEVGSAAMLEPAGGPMIQRRGVGRDFDPRRGAFDPGRVTALELGIAKRTQAPGRPVDLEPFEIARTEVTNRQYGACIEAGACGGLPGWCRTAELAADELPAVCVTWSQAKAFAEWVGGRLPTAEEWEYAYRSAGTLREYPWGDAPPSCENTPNECEHRLTYPVCSKPKGHTEQGLCDMHGNVGEWNQTLATEGWRWDPSLHGKDKGAYVQGIGNPGLRLVSSGAPALPEVPEPKTGFRPVRSVARRAK